MFYTHFYDGFKGVVIDFIYTHLHRGPQGTFSSEQASPLIRTFSNCFLLQRLKGYIQKFDIREGMGKGIVRRLVICNNRSPQFSNFASSERLVDH